MVWCKHTSQHVHSTYTPSHPSLHVSDAIVSHAAARHSRPTRLAICPFPWPRLVSRVQQSTVVLLFLFKLHSSRSMASSGKGSARHLSKLLLTPEYIVLQSRRMYCTMLRQTTGGGGGASGCLPTDRRRPQLYVCAVQHVHVLVMDPLGDGIVCAAACGWDQLGNCETGAAMWSESRARVCNV